MFNTKFVVITGGPGAGKTAVLEMAKKNLCEHVTVLPEAASMIFSAGTFWRLPSESARRATQRAIFHVQDEMERLVAGEKKWSLALCDRGTLDGLAYWPGTEESFWTQIDSDAQTELAKYSTIIHLRTPELDGGYNHQNILRTEDAAAAAVIDLKIERVWSRHPNYIQIPNFPNFLDKAAYAIERIEAEVPGCCPVKADLAGPRP